MSSLKFTMILLIVLASVRQLHSQQVQITKEQLIALTPLWKGERFADGRPKVPDDIMKQMKSVSVEEAWAVMKNAGYGYQVAEGWHLICKKQVAWVKDNRSLILLTYIIPPFAPHMVASFLGVMASAHVWASVPNFLILEWQSYFHTDPMFKDLIKYDGEWVKGSFITLSEKPGIGVEINEQGMKKYAIPGIPFFE